MDALAADIPTVTWPAVLRALALAGLLLGGLAAATPASAESAAQAQAEAEQAAAVVAALEPQVAQALADYGTALSGVGAATTRRVSADAFADATQAVAGARRRAADERVRALYMSGGPVALWATVLDADSGTDALRRVADAERVVGSTRRADLTVFAQADAVRQAAEATDDGVAQATATAADVDARLSRLSVLLARAQRVLDGLSSRARQLHAAEAAAALLRLQQITAENLASSRAASARAWPVPASWSALYRGAAATCPGLAWSVLAAIGQVETGHGRSTGVSSAGAMGPMQFMPETFAAYGIDGDHDGRADITNPADSVYSAAGYLCANGAGKGQASLENALWHYNHADWYVRMVLGIAAQLGAEPARMPS